VLAAALPPTVTVPGVTVCGRFTQDPTRRVHRTATGEFHLAGLAFDHFRA